MKKKINIGIADDHVLVRQGLMSLLLEFEGINVLFDVNNGKELLDALKKNKPDIVLLDIEMPVMNGHEAFELIKIKYPHVKVIIVSTHYKDSYIIEFIKKGVAGFLSKNTDVEKIVDALYSVYELGYYYDSKTALILANSISNNNHVPIPPEQNGFNLTLRELEIIRMICANKTNMEIAEQLGISVRTVEGHRLHIREKTDCKNSLELITFAIKNNLVFII